MSDFPKVDIDSSNVVRIFFDSSFPDVCGIKQELDPATGEAFASRDAAQAWVDDFFSPPAEVEVIEEEAPAIEG